MQSSYLIAIRKDVANINALLPQLEINLNALLGDLKAIQQGTSGLVPSFGEFRIKLIVI